MHLVSGGQACLTARCSQPTTGCLLLQQNTFQIGTALCRWGKKGASSLVERDSLTAAHLQADTPLCPSASAGQGGSELVIHCDVPEEVSHGFTIVDSPNRLRKNQADVHSLYLGTL